MAGLAPETLEKFYQMELLKSLIERKAFSNLLKECTLLLRNLKTFTANLLLLPKFSLMEFPLKITLLELLLLMKVIVNNGLKLLESILNVRIHAMF